MEESGQELGPAEVAADMLDGLRQRWKAHG